ncbi:MAG: hypothetical protein LHV68_09530 [Elusimicrobia bacterium]|nr:hypothetical protein [Candidatus Liberimonas magnetica]
MKTIPLMFAVIFAAAVSLFADIIYLNDGQIFGGCFAGMTENVIPNQRPVNDL